MTFIKFCGMTREEDVSSAIEVGVNAVGFVLWPGSPRHIALDDAATLIAALPSDIVPVGVFVNPSSDDVTRVIERTGIRVAQIHGSREIAAEAVECETWFAASLCGDRLEPAVDEKHTVLLDACDPQRYGGTGRTIDWRRAARVAARRRVMLAGGLTPANVADAVREVRPYGVDVASGIETQPGVKDARAMRAFVAAVREADQ